MDPSTRPYLSVILTSFNESHHLDRILQDLAKQSYPDEKFELLILEAGEKNEDRVREKLGNRQSLLKYYHVPALSRPASLTFLVKESQGELVARVDARTHVDANYLEQLVKLSEESRAANVGGVKIPVGETEEQQLIAQVMSHPLSFGGGKFRNPNYVGHADSVYLGCFRKKLMPPEPWFDEKFPKISEDSDLNFRVRQFGEKVFVDASIKVEHFPRETLVDFLKLSFNYGIGRGLFFLRHKKNSAWRQLIPPLALLSGIILLILGFIYPFVHTLLVLGISVYFFGVIYSAYSISLAKRKIYPEILTYLTFCFVGCHLLWMIGLLKSIQEFRRNMKDSK